MRLSSKIRTCKFKFRRGFTIVELLVAAALSMFIMAILSTAFSKGIDTFRTMRAAGNMQEKLRMAAAIIKRDLAAQHFDGAFHPGLSGPYLTDQRLDQIGWVPPSQGYFGIANPDTGFFEGSDADGIWSTRATSHQIGMTVKLSGQTPDQLFYANCTQLAPGIADYPSSTIFVSQWAEVHYFALSNANSSTLTINNSNTALLTLYRRQAVLVPNSPIPTSAGGVFPDMSIAGGNFNTPSSVTNWANRVQSVPLAVQPFVGDDILLDNVISFEIKPHWTIGPASTTTGIASGPSPTLTYAFPGANPSNNGNWDYPFDILPPSPIPVFGNPVGFRYFDTWSRSVTPNSPNVNWNDGNPANPWSSLNTTGPNTANFAPLRIRIDAIQIKIRIWDNKAQQARQITIVQSV